MVVLAAVLQPAKFGRPGRTADLAGSSLPGTEGGSYVASVVTCWMLDVAAEMLPVFSVTIRTNSPNPMSSQEAKQSSSLGRVGDAGRRVGGRLVRLLGRARPAGPTLMDWVY